MTTRDELLEFIVLAELRRHGVTVAQLPAAIHLLERGHTLDDVLTTLAPPAPG